VPPLAMSDSEPPHLAANATKITYVDGRPTTITLRRFKVAVAEKGVVTEHTFDKDVITLGAMEGNDLVVDDDTVSREHCRIYVADGAYMIEDLDSTNGTFVNPRAHQDRLAEPQPGHRHGQDGDPLSAHRRAGPHPAVGAGALR
jgi:hypothetical protein